MFMLLMDGVAWLVVIGLAVIAFMFAGAVIGNGIAAFRRVFR